MIAKHAHDGESRIVDEALQALCSDALSPHEENADHRFIL
jgi:hypothetical protein